MFGDFVNIDVFINESRSHEISSLIVDSLHDSLNDDSFYNRFETEDDREFIFDFLLNSLNVPEKCLSSYEVLSKLFISLPYKHNLSQEIYNSYLQKLLISTQPILSDNTSQKVQFETLNFISNLLSFNVEEYLNFFYEDTWLVLLNTLTNCINTSINLYFDQKLGAFVNCVLLARVSEFKLYKAVDCFMQNFINVPHQEFYLTNYYFQVLTRFFKFPTKDATPIELLSHKYSIYLLTQMNKLCSEQNKSECFTNILSIENEFNTSSHPFLKPLFPVNQVLRLFADCIFINPCNCLSIICHLNMLSSCSLENDSPWAKIFINFISNYLHGKDLSPDEMSALSILSASNTYITREIFPVLVKKYENSNQAFIHHQSTLLSNLYQLGVALESDNFINETKKMMSKLDLSKIEKPDYKISLFFHALTTKCIYIMSFLMHPDAQQLDFRLISSYLLLLSLVPSFTGGNAMAIENYFYGVLKMLEDINCEEILPQIAIAAISLHKFTDLFASAPMIVSMLFKLAEKYSSKMLLLVAKACTGMMCTPKFAEEVAKNGKTRTMVMNSKILTFIEPDNPEEPLQLLVRKTTGIYYLRILDKQLYTEPQLTKIKKDIYSLEEILNDSDGPFNRANLQTNFVKHSNRTSNFLQSMGIIDIPPESNVSTKKFDDFCIIPEFFVRIVNINLHSTDYSGNNPGSRYIRFKEDLGESYDAQMCKITFKENISSPVVVIFNETKMRFNKNISDLSEPVVLYVSMNDQTCEYDELTYLIRAVRLSKTKIIFPMAEDSDHLCAAKNLAKFIFSFVFYFLGSYSSDENSTVPDILVPFIRNCEERLRFFNNIQ